MSLGLGAWGTCAGGAGPWVRPLGPCQHWVGCQADTSLSAGPERSHRGIPESQSTATRLTGSGKAWMRSTFL